MRARTAAALAAAFALLASSCARRVEKNELEELVVVYRTPTKAPADIKAIESALNERFSNRIGARVRLRPLHASTIERRLDIMLAAETPPDLLVTYTSELHSRVSRGQLRPLDYLLDFAGRGILKAIDPSYLAAGIIQGQVYAVPTIRDYASLHGATLRADLVQKYRIGVGDIRTLADLAPVLQKIKDNEKGIVPLVLSDSASILHAFRNDYDSLGDDAGVLLDFGPHPRVSNLFESPFYSEAIAVARDWHLRGFLPADADTSRETAEDYLASGAAFAALGPQHPGFAGQTSRITGYELRTIPLTMPVTTTDKVGSAMWAISAKSEKPAKAMRFLELLYTDAELVNLLDWGVEGRHYVKVTPDIITFPVAGDGPRPDYQPNHSWQIGNQFLSYLFLGDLPNLWKKTDEFNRSAVKSPALGFTFDPSPIKSTYLAVRGVMNDYRGGLETGTLDPATALPQFRAKLREAGISKVIEEKQRQLDAWLLSTGNARISR